MAQCFLLSKLLGQPPVATPWPATCCYTLASHLLLHLGQPPVATPWPATCCYTLASHLLLHLGQPPVATPSHRDTLLHVKEVQIEYLIFFDIVILNSDFNSASSTPVCTMFKGDRSAEAVWEHFVKLESNGKTVANVIECWFITPSAVTVTVLCYNYTTTGIRNNKYKEQFDQVQ